MYNEMMEQRRPLQSSWCSSVRRIAFKWDLGSVWESQQLPPGWNGDRWRDFLIGVAKKRATEVWHNSIAENDRRIARNYASWLHTADASHMEMAEYLRFAGIEDEGAGGQTQQHRAQEPERQEEGAEEEETTSRGLRGTRSSRGNPRRRDDGN